MAVGLGHVRRSLALATAMAPWADTRVLLGEDEPTIAWVRAGGVDCERVDPSPEGLLASMEPLDPDVVVIDTYTFGSAELERLRAALRLLVVIDDFGRFPVPAHVVVNAACGLTPPPGAVDDYLVGPAFALLAAEFREPPRRQWPTQIERALVVLGAATPPGLMGSLARAVHQALPASAIDVVVGPAADPRLVSRALGDVEAVAVHESPRDMRTLMLAADVAVTAGGVTLLELAATATPLVGVCVAANQRPNLLGLAEAEALLFAGAADDLRLAGRVRDMVGALRFDASRRRTLGERARRAVDGGGAERVAQAIRDRLVHSASSAGRA